MFFIQYTFGANLEADCPLHTSDKIEAAYLAGRFLDAYGRENLTHWRIIRK